MSVPSCLGPLCTVVPVVVAAPGTPGYVPTNAILSSGNDGDLTGTSESTCTTNRGSATRSPEDSDGLAFRSDLPKHMIGPDGFTKKGLSGTHNLDNAKAELNSQGINYTIEPTSTVGISEIRYSFKNSNGKVQAGTKTVYDPAVYSDNYMMKAAQEAGAEAWKEYLKTPNKTFFDTTNGGLNFRSYINFDKNNTPYIGNVHPMK